MEVFPVKTWCSHMALLSPDNIVIPKPDTLCKRCRHSSGNWFCLSCKDTLCSASGNRHMGEHYEQTDHCIAIHCSSTYVAENPIVRCFSCKVATNARQVIRRLQELSSSSNCDHHLASISCDPTAVPIPDTPCKRCQYSKGNWYCLSCKVIFCCASVNGHFLQHYQETKHCLCINCSTKAIYCCSCRKTLDAQVIQQLWVKAQMGRSSSSKLESIDAIIVDVTDILSKRCPSIIDHPQLDAQSFVGQDELALSMEGLQKIFDGGLKALADPVVQEEFLFCSTTLLSAESCPSELKVKLSSFRCNLAEETSAFMKAQADLKVASDISSSITQKKFVVRQQTLKYDEVKKEMVASDEKVANFKAMIKEFEAQIKRLETCLATEESNREKIDEAINSIEKQVTTARDGLVSDLAQVSSIEGSIQAANKLVAQKKLDWDNLKLSFTKFA